MKTIHVYDPPMCCSTGLCGPALDPDLVSFAALLRQLAGLGVSIERYNLSHQPGAFVRNPVVKAFLEQEGAEKLPLMFWDGAGRLQGRHPNEVERGDWLRAPTPQKESAAA